MNAQMVLQAVRLATVVARRARLRHTTTSAAVYRFLPVDLYLFTPIRKRVLRSRRLGRWFPVRRQGGLHPVQLCKVVRRGAPAGAGTLASRRVRMSILAGSLRAAVLAVPARRLPLARVLVVARPRVAVLAVLARRTAVATWHRPAVRGGCQDVRIRASGAPARIRPPRAGGSNCPGTNRLAMHHGDHTAMLRRQQDLYKDRWKHIQSTPCRYGDNCQ